MLLPWILPLTFFVQFMLFSAKNVLVLLTLYCEAYAGVIRLVLIELVVLAGQYCIQDNTGQCTDCQSGQADGDLSDVECDSTCCTVVDTDGQYQDQSGDDNVTALGEVYLSLYDVTNTDCRDHTVQYQRYTTTGSSRHTSDQCCYLRGEGEQYSEACCNTDNSGIEYLGQRQYTGVLTVSGICRSAEQGCNNGSQAIT